MKKLLAVLCVMVMTGMFAGCESEAVSSFVSSPGNSKPVIVSSEAAVSVSPSSASSESDTAETVESMIPDPTKIFVTKGVTISKLAKDSGVGFMIKGYTEAEYDAYVKACKENSKWVTVSVDVTSEEGKAFGIYSDDKKYYLQTGLDPKSKTVYIICQLSDDKK